MSKACQKVQGTSVELIDCSFHMFKKKIGDHCMIHVISNKWSVFLERINDLFFIQYILLNNIDSLFILFLLFFSIDSLITIHTCKIVDIIKWNDLHVTLHYCKIGKCKLVLQKCVV